MSERLLGEVTAAYVLKNGSNGWLEYALQVLAAGPYLRRELVGELCQDVQHALEQRLEGHEVDKVTTEVGEGGIWFSVDVTRDAWGDLGVTLCNWKDDARNVGIGVYNYGDRVGSGASAQIRDCLAKKRPPWNRKREPRWMWNIWPDLWNWSPPDFLARIADDREREHKVVAGEVAKEVLEVVDLMDDVLKRVAEAD